MMNQKQIIYKEYYLMVFRDLYVSKKNMLRCSVKEKEKEKEKDDNLTTITDETIIIKMQLKRKITVKINPTLILEGIVQVVILLMFGAVYNIQN